MKLKFIGKRDEVKDVVTFMFEPEEKLGWQPGQYMHYVFDVAEKDEKGPERWFTNSAAPYEGKVFITTRLDNLPVSAVKKYLNNLAPGNEIEADGPKGKFVLQADAKKYVLIAGGIGITPFRSMLAQLAHDHGPANAMLLYANRDNNFVFDQELASFSQADKTLEIRKC
jgi:ferredoxin-NADP reductase